MVFNGFEIKFVFYSLSLFQNPYYMPCNHATCQYYPDCFELFMTHSECAVEALKTHKQCPLCKCPCNKRMLNPATQVCLQMSHCNASESSWLRLCLPSNRFIHRLKQNQCLKYDKTHFYKDLNQLSQPDPPELLINEIQNDKYIAIINNQSIGCIYLQ